MFIDGEFWFGRGMFSLTSSLINKDVHFVLWDQFRAVAFDNPSLEIQQKTFEERYSQLLSIPVYHQFTIIASRMNIEPILFENFSQKIIEDEGEGVIARKYGSLYENGRSLSLLKFKKVSTDREGIVVDIQNGSVSLLVPEGVTLTVSAEDIFINTTTVNIGDIVTFSYERAARTDVPSQIKIQRERKDLSWQDVVENFHKDKHVVDSSFKSPTWNNKTMRIFLEEFVTEKGLDPFSEDTWYSLNTSELYQDTRGRAILRRFNGYRETIQKLFPEMIFDVTLFTTIPKWGDINNRKKFFERFAKKNGFDPLNPDAWYRHNNRQLFGKQIYGIEKYHKNSVAQALLDLFPDIGLDRLSLQSAWNDRANRRMFFEHYARANGFDPLDSRAWQLQSISKIKSHKRVRSVLAHYGNNFSKALNDIFPEIGWKITSYATWGEFSKRRMFFEQYAKTNGFDPLVAENWYRLTRKQLKAIPGVRSLLLHHGHSILRALQELFPEIGLVLSKWTRV